MKTAGRGLPGGARWLLAVVVPADWGPDIVRDVEEAYALRTGRFRRVWLWGVVLSFAIRFLPERLREAGPRTLPTSLDLRLAMRAAARSWGLTLLTVVAMAIGIGATAAAFGLIDGAFYSGLPFPGGDRIYRVEDFNVTRNTALWVRGDEYERRRDVLTSFERLGGFYSRGVVLGGDRRVGARFVTPEILAMTEVSPLLGRLPDGSDSQAGAEPVVVLPHDLWSDAFGADPSVIGRRIEVSGVQRTVIGVMPAGFGFPYGDEIWIPFDPGETTEFVQMIGKLREGVGVSTAEAELSVVARQNPAQVQSADDVVRTLVIRLDRPLTGNAQVYALALPLLGLILLLVVMATNVATVVIARNATRTGEIAVRMALGASRRRVIGQLVLEVALAVSVAAAIGLAMARMALGQFEVRADLPMWIDFSLDPRIAVFTIALAALATTVAGLLPALRTTSGSLFDALKDGGRGASRLKFGRITDTIIIAELGISIGFLAAASVLGQSLLSFGYARYGLPASETLLGYLYFGQPESLRDPHTIVSAEDRRRFWAEHYAGVARRRDRIVEESRRLSGVRAVTVASRFPGDESETELIETEDGRVTGARAVEVADIGEGYFDFLGVRVGQGRDFRDTEYATDIPVALVDEPFVRTWFGGGNAIGRRLRVAAGSPEEAAGPWLEIVGVVPDIGLAVGDPARSGTVFRPIRSTNVMWIGLRGEGDPNRWSPVLTETVRRVDESIVLTGVQTLERLMMLPVMIYRSLGAGFLGLGVMALLLSAASLHAVTATSVTKRTRELGIRRALGAPTASLVTSTVRRAVVQVSIGSVLGLAIAGGLLRIATIFPWRLAPGDPRVLAVVPFVLTAAVMLALTRPLSRALSVRPADALRCE